MTRFSAGEFRHWIAESLTTNLPTAGFSWVPCKSGGYLAPVSWFLTGLAVDMSSDDDFYLYAYSFPLIIPAPSYLGFNYSRKVTANDRLTFPIPNPYSAQAVSDEIARAWVEQDAEAFLARRGSPQGFLEYIDEYRREAPVDAAMKSTLLAVEASACHLLLDDIAEARAQLITLLDWNESGRAKEFASARDLLQAMSTGRAPALDRLAEIREVSFAAQVTALNTRPRI